MLSLIFIREKTINLVSRKLIYLHCLSNSPAKIYLFKVNNRKPRKGVKHVQNYQGKHQNDVVDVDLISFFG